MSDLLVQGRFLLGLLVACGGASQATPGTPVAATESEQPGVASGNDPGEGEVAAEPGPAPTNDERSSEPAGGVPTQCTPVDGLCVPPRAFVKKLCQDAYSGL